MRSRMWNRAVRGAPLRAACALLCAAAALAPERPAAAQDPQLEIEQPPAVEIDPVQVDPVQPEEIVVRGERLELSLFETTSSTAVIGTEDLASGTVFDVQDALLLVPNVNDTSGGEAFSIRGIGAFSIAGAPLTAGGLASMVIDGAVLPEFAMRVGPLEAWDLQQIEVLRGPQSTNLGRNALAGAIVMTSQDPEFEWSGRARAAFGNYDTRALSLGIGGPLVPEQLAFRVSYDGQYSDGFVQNEFPGGPAPRSSGSLLGEPKYAPGNDAYAHSSNRTLRAKLRFEPAGWNGLSGRLTLFDSRNRSGDDVVAQSVPSQSGFLAVDPFSRKIFANLPGKEDNDTKFATLQLQLPLADAVSLHATTALIRNRYHRREDLDRGPFNGGDLRSRDFDSRTLTQELRMSVERPGVRSDAGLYHYAYSAHDDSAQPQGAGAVSSLARSGFSSQVRNWAAFWNAEFDLGDHLTLVAGTRYDWERLQADDFLRIRRRFPGGEIRTGSDHSGASTSRALLPKVGLKLRWTEDLVTSFTWQKAYRAGGFDLKQDGQSNSYAPEYTNNYELALRYRTPGGALELHANAFWVDWRDQQVIVSGGAGGSGSELNTVNAGSSWLRGGELMLQLRPNPDWRVFASFGWLRTRFREFDAGNVDLSGNEFSNAPHNSYSAGIIYQPESGWLASLTADYLGRSFFEVSNEALRSKDYNPIREERFLLNARVGYRFDRFGAYLYAKNLLDAEYRTAIFPTRRELLKVGAPRQLGVEIRSEF